MTQEEVIAKIKEMGANILPQGSSLWLYGSRARGDAHEDSDYDLLILLDKEKITSDDHDNYVYPLRVMGWDMKEEINPQIYTRSQWQNWTFLPYYKNVEQDKRILL